MDLEAQADKGGISMGGKTIFNYKCNNCGIDMYAKPSRIKRTKRICCSRKCSSELRKEYMKGEGNHQFGLKGDKNPTYSEKETRVRDGYLFRRNYNHPFSRDNGWILEHRLIAEKNLLDEENTIIINGEKYLKPSLIVHHKDFNKRNNDINNLEIMTLEEHTRIHNLLDPVPRDKKTGQFKKTKGFESTRR